MRGSVALSMILALTAFSVSATFAGESAKSTSPAWMVGTWVGTGYQTGGSTWSIALQVNGRGPTCTINYPSLSCGGTWSLLKLDAGVAWFEERIEHGVSRCTNGGKVAVTRVGDRYLSYSYFLPKTGELAASSTLTRQRPAPPTR